MRLPYFILTRSWLPVFFGKLFSHGPFAAMAVGPWILFPTGRIELRVLRHELRHVAQFYALWGVGLAGWVLAFLMARSSFWWLLATPLTYSAVYVVLGILNLFVDRSFYHDNPLELDARRHAGEPVE